MMKRLSFFLVALAILSSAGCSVPERTKVNCICLIDYSGSISENMLERYIDVLGADVLPYLGENDRLIVLPIDEGSRIESIKIIYLDLKQHKFSYPTDGYVHAADSTRKRIHDYVIGSIRGIQSEIIRQRKTRSKFSRFTDILGALEQSAMYVEQTRKPTERSWLVRMLVGDVETHHRNVVLLFSDMKHESSEYSFSRAQGVAPEAVPKMMTALRTRNRLPDFRGCDVFVYGRTGDSNLQIDNIKNFWVTYFSEAGAELHTYDYDPDNLISAFMVDLSKQQH
jgi:hypothetical protein